MFETYVEIDVSMLKIISFLDSKCSVTLHHLMVTRVDFEGYKNSEFRSFQNSFIETVIIWILKIQPCCGAEKSMLGQLVMQCNLPSISEFHVR